MGQDRHAGANALVLLRVIPKRDAVAQSEAPGIRLRLASEDPQQAGLAGSVQPHDQQPLPALDLEIDVAEHGWAAVTLGQAFDRHHDSTAVWWIWEFDLDLALALRRCDLLRLEAVDTLEDRLGRACSLLGLPAHDLGQQAQ